MFQAIGSDVIELHKSQVGNIDLGMLNGRGEGCWRALNRDEIYNGLGWRVTRVSQKQSAWG